MNRLFLLVLFASCGPTEDPPTPPIPDPPLSFSHDVMPVLKAKCAGCHSGQYEDRATTLTRLQASTAANAACASTPRIVVNDGAGSLLVKKLRGTAGCGAVMPLVKHGATTMACAGDECVAASDIEKVKGWIDQGARDN